MSRRVRPASPACSRCRGGSPLPLVRLGLHVDRWDHVVALAGNPNTGKSTVFNALTGLRQHTGNWPGKTVARAEGAFSHDGKRYKLVDLPGTYSLLSASQDEEVARDFLLFGRPDVTLVVVDSTRLERNLNLVLQVLAITERAVVALNLADEAERHGLQVDDRRLSRRLGVPVITTSARSGRGIPELIRAVGEVASGDVRCRPHRVEIRDPAVRRALDELVPALGRRFPRLPNAGWVAQRLLDGDDRIYGAVASGELGSLAAARAPDPSPAGESTTAPAGGGASVGASAGDINALATRLRWEVGRDFHDTLTETVYGDAARMASEVVHCGETPRISGIERRIDRLLTSRWLGFPVMLVLLTLVFWITIAGANYPSRWLSALLLDTLHPLLKDGVSALGAPSWLGGMLVDGTYLTTAWVVSVMLPPMAIFFPLFTLLEDLGYLPRVAFNIDRLFKWAGAHGKQALTMCMGFGCNAAGVTATRIIDSPRERLIGIITNNFALCNGRWPLQILLASVFIGSLAPPATAGAISALAVVSVTLLGVALMFVVSWMLSRTWLRGEVSTFSLELPPYRPPRVLQTLYTSLIDRTLFVLWRAVVFAAPAGAVIWLISNVDVAGASLAEHAISGLDGFGLLLGLNGVILLAYIVAVAANEIVLPTVLMLIVLTGRDAGVGDGAGVIFDPGSDSATAAVLRAGGWTTWTAVSVMLFSLVHNPCSTTLYTIWKETRSVRWTLVAALLPLVLGFLLCFLLARAVALL